MYRNIILTIVAIGFWILIGIFVYDRYQKYKPVKIDESPYLVKLQGKWKRVSDNQEVEYILPPTNIFSVLNSKYKDEDFHFLGYFYKEGDIEFSDISLKDSVNNIFDVYMKNDNGNFNVDLRILNDSTFKVYNDRILETYIKMK